MKDSIVESLYEDCTLCPRACHVNRQSGQTGYCGESAVLRCARAALHFWEEPILSGTGGSGAVFFSGCNLRCIYCQNRQIALGSAGIAISTQRLAEIFLELQEQGAHNINLITGVHFIPTIVTALRLAKEQGLHLPVVYNSGGYESVRSLKLLEGLVDIYLPDFKYMDPTLAAAYSHAPDYFDIASAAIAEMVRQTGAPVLGEDGLLRRGVIVRHLLLPGQNHNTKKILRYLHETYGDQIYLSIMNQYTPLAEGDLPPELRGRVSAEEYERVLKFADSLGIERGFFQEGETAAESFIPAFDGSGVLPAHSPSADGCP